MKRDRELGSARTISSIPAYDISALRILVLEKHLLMRRLLTDVFREFGCPTVIETGDSEAAYEMFMQSPIDMILTDWTPDLDGMGFLKRLRTDPGSPNPFVPVIVVTANTELHHIFTARDTGMTEYLAKPLSAITLYKRIVVCIEQHRQFIKAGDFFGPDRRRRKGTQLNGPDRRNVQQA